jgi:hypothetical protein
MRIKDIYPQPMIVEILADARAIQVHLDAITAHEFECGTVIPMRINLGSWEQMRLAQARMIREAS